MDVSAVVGRHLQTPSPLPHVVSVEMSTFTSLRLSFAALGAASLGRPGQSHFLSTTGPRPEFTFHTAANAVAKTAALSSMYNHSIKIDVYGDSGRDLLSNEERRGAP